MDGTIVRGDIVRYYVHFRTRGRGPLGRAAFILGYLPQVARWLWLDRVDRARMNVEFYRGYAGMDAKWLARAAEEDYPMTLGRRVFAGARAAVERHRREGRAVVLVSGSLDVLLRPLARDLGAYAVLSVRMTETADGRLTGELDGPPLAGEEKARVAREWAAAHGVDLRNSWAYGDSTADLHLLQAVGHGVAVNPGSRLRAAVRGTGIEMVRWD